MNKRVFKLSRVYKDWKIKSPDNEILIWYDTIVEQDTKEFRQNLVLGLNSHLDDLRDVGDWINRKVDVTKFLRARYDEYNDLSKYTAKWVVIEAIDSTKFLEDIEREYIQTRREIESTNDNYSVFKFYEFFGNYSSNEIQLKKVLFTYDNPKNRKSFITKNSPYFWLGNHKLNDFIDGKINKVYYVYGATIGGVYGNGFRIVVSNKETYLKELTDKYNYRKSLVLN